jgi:hypothetical protein
MNGVPGGRRSVLRSRRMAFPASRVGRPHDLMHDVCWPSSRQLRCGPIAEISQVPAQINIQAVGFMILVK